LRGADAAAVLVSLSLRVTVIFPIFEKTGRRVKRVVWGRGVR